MKHRSGCIEVICGSMFCGKTEELIRRVRRATIAQQQVQVFKPHLDDRYNLYHVTSHSGQNISATVIRKAADVLKYRRTQTTVIAIDEVQFLDAEIVAVVKELAGCGIRVILAGLDMDFRGEPFGAVPQLMAIAESVTKLQAICIICGDPASHTQRLVNGQPAHYHDSVILVGAEETYEARCREHHQVPN
jgi:thymidine kinase